MTQMKDLLTPPEGPEALRLIADWFDATDHQRGWYGSEVQDELRRIARELEELRAETTWIPIKVEIPTVGSEVLTFTPDGGPSIAYPERLDERVAVARRRERGGAFDWDRTRHGGNITHWRPYPRLPLEDPE